MITDHIYIALPMRQALFYAFDGYLFIHFVLTATL